MNQKITIVLIVAVIVPMIVLTPSVVRVLTRHETSESTQFNKQTSTKPTNIQFTGAIVSGDCWFASIDYPTVNGIDESAFSNGGCGQSPAGSGTVTFDATSWCNQEIATYGKCQFQITAANPVDLGGQITGTGYCNGIAVTSHSTIGADQSIHLTILCTL